MKAAILKVRVGVADVHWMANYSFFLNDGKMVELAN